MVYINWVAVCVATIVHFGVGAVWYSKKGFGDAWMRAIGITMDQATDTAKHGMVKPLVISFICSLLLAFSTVHFVNLAQAGTVIGALRALVYPTIGFVLAPVAMGIEFERRTWRYFWITGGYLVVGIVIAAITAIVL